MSLLKRIEKGGGSSGGSGGQQPPNDSSNRGFNAPTPDPEEESKLASMRMRRQVVGPERPAASQTNSYQDLKSRVHTRLLSELDQSMDLTRKA